ncbi:MAG TPA: LysE family transporter [Candidatus Rhabdochlamydia sp.]|jgi:threonine/homoserine/homoserine lactone efflux protein|nr:LysE family transporter [Candidatus Rhabdochlamydia sp.]
MIPLILKSILLGFLITLPVGPIGILCLRKILQLGALFGFILGLSQLFAIFIFSIIITFGMSLVSGFIIKYEFWFRLMGGLMLIGFGVKIFFSKGSASSDKAISTKNFISDFFSIVFLTLINPPVVLAFLAIFTGLGLYRVTSLVEQLLIILGILLGSIFSWTIICLCFAGYKKNATQKLMSWINRSAGVFLTSFGFAACISAIVVGDV